MVVVRLVLWNKLPVDIRNGPPLENFKSVLETRLFKVASADKKRLSLKYLSAFTDILFGVSLYSVLD